MKNKLPIIPALAEGTVSHSRNTPLKHKFKNKVYMWLVDLDDLPEMRKPLRPFSTFSSKDHIGSPAKTIKENIVDFCKTNGIDVSDHRIIMLANARIFGYTFDPLSVFWVIDPSGNLTCIVAEVHNTYGEKHAYFLKDVDSTGKSTVPKVFYVSPFFTVEGKYNLQFKLTEEVVSSTVILLQNEEIVFTAVFRGKPKPVTTLNLIKLLIKMPLITNRNALSIRIHGIWLWLRKLPIVPRPKHEPQEIVNGKQESANMEGTQ